ncbi:hypothetical protein AVEN_210401-1 [Araneus ventricosus]|uniref:Uncharacterized protein n=1 Tax=Araneus ventricosus TaxID=182803 RepID=A0A4Y2LA43_ARAVE|nr:hypothetical protein AVEN_186567-1 [Araneus ventricosus]GBN11352.1 hypothetical protein AVEN_210401-1 [Araneus ventricosus]
MTRSTVPPQPHISHDSCLTLATTHFPRIDHNLPHSLLTTLTHIFQFTSLIAHNFQQHFLRTHCPQIRLIFSSTLIAHNLDPHFPLYELPPLQSGRLSN